MILHIPNKGRCVFADKKYTAWDTIEICEYIVIPFEQIEILKKTVLNNYWFWWAANGDACILLWNGSLYSHSKTPNMTAMIDDDKSIWFVAIRSIQKWEELTFDYGYTPDFPYMWDAKIVKRIKGIKSEK